VELKQEQRTNTRASALPVSLENATSTVDTPLDHEHLKGENGSG
jgi:hypothetical protein